MKKVIGVDLGTTGVKVLLFDERGAVMAEASREQALSCPAPGFAEQDPAAWYEVPCGLIRQLLEQTGLPAGEVGAIGISSQGISVVPVDEALRPLAPGISWLDTRATDEVEQMLGVQPKEAWFASTGKHISPLYTLPKLIWLRKHRPRLFARARYFLMPMDYFIARMTGNALTDPTMAGGTMLYDLNRRGWSPEIAGALGVDIGKMARVVPCGTLAGTLNRESARLSGLEMSTAVAVGAQDQKIAAYGAGLSENVATLSLGTAAALEFMTARSSDVLPIFPYVDGENKVLEGCVNTAGAAIRWARDVLFPGEGYAGMNGLAEQAPIGSGGVIFRPHLSGSDLLQGDVPRFGQFQGISLSTGRAELMRAIYEGLACEIRAYVDAARRSHIRVSRLRAFGGGCQSDVFCGIIASVCGVPLDACDTVEMAAFGAAKAAAHLAGIGACTFGLEQPVRTFPPEAAQEYEHVYRRYLKGD